MTAKAHGALKPLGKKAAANLHDIADYLLDRDY